MLCLFVHFHLSSYNKFTMFGRAFAPLLWKLNQYSYRRQFGINPTDCTLGCSGFFVFLCDVQAAKPQWQTTTALNYVTTSCERKIKPSGTWGNFTAHGQFFGMYYKQLHMFKFIWYSWLEWHQNTVSCKTCSVPRSWNIFKGSVDMDYSCSSHCVGPGSQLSQDFGPRTCSNLEHWNLSPFFLFNQTIYSDM